MTAEGGAAEGEALAGGMVNAARSSAAAPWWNARRRHVVFCDGRAAALIDLDMAAPGRAVWDVP